MSSSAADSSSALRARVAVINAMTSAFTLLLGVGLDLVRAATIALAGTAGAAEIGCRLTDPYPAPKTRVIVLMIILVAIVQLVGLGYPPIPTLAAVLGAASVDTQIARRLAGLPYPRLRLS